jgi:FAD synthetase
MAFGTFDVLHKGHGHFFRQARALAPAPARPFLIVSVARDKNVQRIKRQAPLYGERQRLAAVRVHPLVDRAIMGAVGDHIPHIAAQKPDIIALGYDQRNYVRGLQAALRRHGLDVKIIRLKPHQPHKYKSSIVKKQLSRKKAR